MTIYHDSPHVQREAKVASIEPGSTVRLHWWGDSSVPMWLHHTWATVEQVRPGGRLLVRPRLDPERTRTINPARHVCEVK